MSRLFVIFLLVIGIGGGLFWAWTNVPEFKTLTSSYMGKGKFQTLEVRYSADTIMEKHKKDLLKDEQHSYLDPDLKFHPYLLLEVKYNRTNDKTVEGIILWSLVDGEMVINTSSWERTHGFADCLKAGADKNDFKVINVLSGSKNFGADRDALAKVLNVDNDVLDMLVENCRKKNLIVQSGNHFRLHLQNPKMKIEPETKLEHWIVTKPAKTSSVMARKFKAYQIRQMAKAAFGNDFAISRDTEVFLPVYSITVQNPDGSQMTSYWNALNGRQLEKSLHIE
jgi:hypothetical protein